MSPRGRPAYRDCAGGVSAALDHVRASHYGQKVPVVTSGGPILHGRGTRRTCATGSPAPELAPHCVAVARLARMGSATADTQRDWQVVCLCAAWCGVCREWGPVFEALRDRYPQVAFAWVDVEDEADALGDVDIETFPTLLVAQGDAVRFLGPVQPSAAQVARLLESLLANPPDSIVDGPGPRRLLEQLRTAVLLKR